MRYIGDIYRPPSEARSLIIQLTVGCARNNCTFCSMYKAKQFRIRPLEDVVADLVECQQYYGPYIKRIFLADGDALIVPTDKLLYILEVIKKLFPKLDRVSAYGAPADLLLKTPEELRKLKDAGLDMVYIGMESGSDTVLKNVCKGATANEIVEGSLKAQEAGMVTSITVISGLGGADLMEEHAIESAEAISRIKPDYASLLALMFHPDTPLYEQEKRGEFKAISPEEILGETKIFLQHIDSEGTVFRSNHASNYVSLAGNFNTDIPRMIAQLDRALETHNLKPEWYRGF